MSLDSWIDYFKDKDSPSKKSWRPWIIGFLVLWFISYLLLNPIKTRSEPSPQMPRMWTIKMDGVPGCKSREDEHKIINMLQANDKVAFETLMTLRIPTGECRIIPIRRASVPRKI